MLVPEIALTPQTVARFAARFGDTVALLHSALSEGERYDEWRRLRTGEARIAVGPRSAVFAPVERARADRRRRGARRLLQARGRPALRRPPRRGLPRLPVRRAAARRLGHAASGDRRTRTASGCACPTRVAGAPRPCRPCACSTCARRSTRCTPRRGGRSRARASRSCCSTAAAGRTSSPAGRAARRGSARAATSRSCCTAPSARSPATTAATASRSRPLRRLRLARRRPPRRRHRARRGRAARRRSTCRSSGSTPTRRRPRTPCRSCSRASTPRPPGLLLGTQMVAKGHDFPDVTLGVVLDADSTLRFPDFRAEERTFALIAQLAGRAGRGPQGGRVLVQTRSPDAPSIDAAARHDADGFLAGELERRRALRYPPFADLIRVVRSALDAAPPAPPPRAIARRHRRARTPSCSAPRRCFACATASATSSCSRPSARADGDRRHRRRRRGRRARQDVPRRELLRRCGPGLTFPRRGGRSPHRGARRGRRAHAAARSRDPRAARGGAEARPQVRRPGAALARAGDRPLRRRARRGGRAGWAA